MAICKYCGEKFEPKSHTKGLYCSLKCFGLDHRKEKNINWNGGKKFRDDGYIDVYIGRIDGKTTYRREHRLVMENHLGRKLETDEQIHHLNGNKTDNRIENFEIINPSEHTIKYHLSVKNPEKWNNIKCDYCGTIFPRLKSRTNKNRNFCCWDHYLKAIKK